MRPTGDFAKVNRHLDSLITYENSEGVTGESFSFTYSALYSEIRILKLPRYCNMWSTWPFINTSAVLFCACASPPSWEEDCHTLTSSHFYIFVDQQILSRRSEWVFHLFYSSYFVDDVLHTPSRYIDKPVIVLKDFPVSQCCIHCYLLSIKKKHRVLKFCTNLGLLCNLLHVFKQNLKFGSISGTTKYSPAFPICHASVYFPRQYYIEGEALLLGAHPVAFILV